MAKVIPVLVFWATLFSSLLFSNSFAQADYSISFPTGAAFGISPEASGTIGDGRIGFKSVSGSKSTFTDDTGPWPPDFSEPKVSAGSASGLELQLGFFNRIDFLVLFGFQGMTEAGFKLQLLGPVVRESKKGSFSLSALGVGLTGRKTDSKRNGCLVSSACDSRSWNANFKGTKLGAVMGYRVAASLLVLAEYAQLQYSASGKLRKTEGNITRDEIYEYSGSGNSKSFSAGVQYDWGDKNDGWYILVQGSAVQSEWEKSKYSGGGINFSLGANFSL